VASKPKWLISGGQRNSQLGFRRQRGRRGPIRKIRMVNTGQGTIPVSKRKCDIRQAGPLADHRDLLPFGPI